MKYKDNYPLRAIMITIINLLYFAAFMTFLWIQYSKDNVSLIVSLLLTLLMLESTCRNINERLLMLRNEIKEKIKGQSNENHREN